MCSFLFYLLFSVNFYWVALGGGNCFVEPLFLVASAGKQHCQHHDRAFKHERGRQTKLVFKQQAKILAAWFIIAIPTADSLVIMKTIKRVYKSFAFPATVYSHPSYRNVLSDIVFKFWGGDWQDLLVSPACGDVKKFSSPTRVQSMAHVCSKMEGGRLRGHSLLLAAFLLYPSASSASPAFPISSFPFFRC